MLNVGVAGGTGGVGRTIVEVLASSKHNAVVFSRRPGDGVIIVDYGSVDALVDILESNNIHTANLTEAAIRSESTKRFIPSSYAISCPQEAFKVLPQLKYYFDAIETLKHSGLEWTVFHDGIFLDYFGGPSLKSHLKHNVFVIDLANKVAAIPGDGNATVTFTYTFDLAKFVVAALDLEQWPQESRVVGDEMTWNEFVALAEKITGSKFEIHHDTIERLKRFEITELPGHRALYEHFPKKAYQWFMSTFELFTTDGGSWVPREGSLNELFPGIQPLTVRDVLEQYWAGN
ncbi:uncharacterized protein BDV17DRAFT_293318 [Aspergillus undulatus]|uniref:uncharacterized protein n=1 Tax=Aspergillus undulatus TaxID=1810928 RepID=UPI003CCC9626